MLPKRHAARGDLLQLTAKSKCCDFLGALSVPSIVPVTALPASAGLFKSYSSPFSYSLEQIMEMSHKA